MRRFFRWLLVMVLLAGGYTVWALARPLPALQPQSILAVLPQETGPSLPWPSYGSAAVGAVGYGVLASSGPQKPLPTASVAKIMTALAVLQKKPLKAGEQGPLITIGDSDINYYNDYVAQQGSVVAVDYGEQLSEYQALQALLLPSGDNIAKTLVVWAFGSEKAYTNYSNEYAKRLGIRHSHFNDASGLDPKTVGTANDLVLLGEAALKNPVISQIAAQQTADLPVAGTVQNVNIQLGQNGINGIKTGNSEEAGGVYLASGTYTLAGHEVTVVSIVMSAPNLDSAMQDTLPLLESAKAGFDESTVVRRGDIVGYYNTPWHTSANIVSTSDMKAFGWKSRLPQPHLTAKSVHVPSSKDQNVGTLTLAGNRAGKATLQQNINPPTWQWRLFHP